MSGDEIDTAEYVKLNVGGYLFQTTLGTLTKHHDDNNMFKAMFSGRIPVKKDKEGFVLIDRSGKHFDVILNFLRDGLVNLPENKVELGDLCQEARYYCISELTKLIEQKCRSLEKPFGPICQIPLICYEEQKKKIVSSSTKPVVSFLCNRHNNKYSYSSNSNENLLLVMELFNKLASRLSHRIVFIRDISSKHEICTWGFYAHGRTISEVCCTSIVYGTDKKQTRIDYPEAKLYEEMLNLMLYENQEGTVDFHRERELLSGSANYSDDELEERSRRK